MSSHMRCAGRTIGPTFVGVLALAALALAGCGGADENPTAPSASPSPSESGPRVCIVGENGAILLTTDGGAHWQQRPSGTRETLLDVAFADARSGWAVGSAGTVLHTADGGMTWGSQESGLESTEQTLVGIACTSPSVAWAVGPDAALSTVDGGAHWLRVTREERSRSSLPAAPTLAFADAEVGWAVSREEISITRDGGAHWTTQWSFTPGGRAHSVGPIVCADTEHVWAGGSVGMPMPGEPEAAVLGSNDGGRTWKRQLETTTSLEDLCCTDARHVWTLTQDALYRTVDGGAHWRRVRHFPNGPYGTALAFSDARHGWLVVEPRRGGDLILATADGGLTWQRQARVALAVSDYVNDMEAY